VTVSVLLAVIVIETSVFAGVVSWALLRLVRQLDSACREIATLATASERLAWRLDEHEKLHNYRQRAADPRSGQFKG
jgi:hypothetical protein